VSYSELENPFAVTGTRQGEVNATDVEMGSEAENAESIRRQFLHHERAVGSIGSLFFISSLMSLLASISVVAIPFAIKAMERPQINVPPLRLFLAISLCLIGLVVLQSLVTIALRRRLSHAREAAMLIALIGLLAVPFGTIFGVYILIVLGAKATPYVMSDDYRKVIRATPQYDAAPLSWLMLGLVVAAIAATLAALLLIG
jgi:hypothetical protein